MTPRDLLRNAALATGNLVRSLRRKGLDWVVLSIRGSYPERTVRRDPLPFPFNRLSLFPAQVSLQDVRSAVEMIGADRRVQGVVVRIEGLQAGLATVHSLRRILLDLRAQGKRLVAWLPMAGLGEYVLASACDEVILPPSGRLIALGLRAEPLFLKDALATAGVEADLEAIAEYKVAPDMFRRSTMSEPHREMLEGLLDSLFGEIVAEIAIGRGLEPARVRELIDAGPLDPAEAVEAGLADAILYEDELAAHLSSAATPAPMLTWHAASRQIYRPIKWTARPVIGVVSLEGMIVPGRSRRIPIPAPVPLPFGEVQAGAQTIVQALRRAETDKRVAAVILHVETPGGAALASDLICHEVGRLRERKPVVVLMGQQATSGGYYVSALANRIIARPATLTGSIGIWGGKLVLADLQAKLGIHREVVQRGAMAGLYSQAAPFSEKERASFRRDLGQSYARFKAIVAEGRSMTEEQVEQVARGRLWTGVQARENGLVDELGDFDTALAAVKELAGLRPDRTYAIEPIHPPRHAVLPPPYPMDGGTAFAGALFETLQDLAREQVWALAPWSVRVW